MQNAKIEEKINDLNEIISINNYLTSFELLVKSIFGDLKISVFVFFLILFEFNTIWNLFYDGNDVDIKCFKKYIKDCKNLKKYNRKKIYNKNPYISVCIPALNMENYIEYNLLSIINQSFQDFEIVNVNDASTEQTENILKKSIK